ncbi:MBL fold metallo-hydrolase [Bacillus sp. B15-48]|uniref:MBL fold metallo-hydrolase n=1 Tax=Bacillus sp. B15-48 TaxID=1548601 RepID=UPI00193FF837|nr:MBL fold metallo-hydrolase [Bacillus sp. B15-48]MBM4764341.1 MBL fold metallo-hydrolase [Bacillus sp. B15-48]
MKKPVQLTEKVHLIDGFDLGVEERTGSYVLLEQDLTIIETSASPSVPHILNGLKELGLALEEVKNIIVTHIHLDHSGGAGLLLTHCPNATVFVHSKGARHLADPSRLIASAKTVYGEDFDSLFNPILPIPEDRLVIKNDGDTLEIGANCSLTFFDTPGHANHHFSIYHSGVNGIFTGDTSGIYYPQLHRKGIEFYLPTTSPNQFDPDKMLTSIEKYKRQAVDRIFFGHYGMSENPQEVFKQVEAWLEVFVAEAKVAYTEGSDFDNKTEIASKRILEKIQKELQIRGVHDKDPIYKILSLDVQVSAMGLIDYLTKKNT